MIRLPIDPQLPSLVQAVEENLNVVLTATPGAGKTTRLPPELLKAVKGQVLVLEPRRMAAVSACARVCEERGWRIGEQAGYQVRFESKVGRDTRLVYLTDALLLRRMIDDPELRDAGLVVIDEFHERNLNQDLILGALRELQEMGRPLKLLVMSATLDADRLSRFLGGAHIVDVAGEVFPLQVRHSQQALSLRTDASFFERVTQAALAGAAETDGDVLVFLPGTGEIARVGERLETQTRRQIVPLHGSLPLADQQKVLGPPTQPRIILATNVAEASVTVQGVDRVIDTGLAKIMEMNPRTGFSSLELKRISLFNARQRSGRAARQRAGVSFRLWTEHEEVTQSLEPVPECQRMDLSSALMWLAHLGVSDFASFSWLDRPPAILLDGARNSLLALKILDSSRRLTELGRRLMRFPVPPRLGVLLALGDEMGVGQTAARLAAILAERDFAEAVNTTANTECDMLLRLDLLHETRTRAAQNVIEASRQLGRLVGAGEADDQMVRRLLLLSHRDRLCRRREKSERAVMMGGRGVRLQARSQVRNSEFFVALQGVDLPGQADTSIGLACGFDKSFLLKTFGDQVQAEEDIHFDEAKGQFYARRTRRLGDLILEEPVLTSVDPERLGDRLAEVLVTRWDWLVSQHEGLTEWMARWKFFIRHEPQWSERLSAEVIRQVIEGASYGHTGMAQILSQDLVGFLESSLGPEAVKTLREQVPPRFTAPSGVAHKIHYEEMGAYVEVRLQEMFGLQSTPKLAFQKVPLTFRLLGPNFRPVQVTSDLAGFWRSGYVEVRKELRARYPKHSWPEDPLTAKPEAKGRRR